MNKQIKRCMEVYVRIVNLINYVNKDGHEHHVFIFIDVKHHCFKIILNCLFHHFLNQFLLTIDLKSNFLQQVYFRQNYIIRPLSYFFVTL
jgi:hypothetical protein